VDLAVVLNKAEFPEFVHEEIDAGPRCARCNRRRSRHANALAREGSPPSPKKSPGPRIATTASLPVLLTTESFTPPSWMYMTFFAGPPWPKMISLPRNRSIFRPRPADSRNNFTSKTGTLGFAFLGERRTSTDTRIAAADDILMGWTSREGRPELSNIEQPAPN
jgi:hypothetical protein